MEEVNDETSGFDTSHGTLSNKRSNTSYDSAGIHNGWQGEGRHRFKFLMMLLW